MHRYSSLRLALAALAVLSLATRGSALTTLSFGASGEIIGGENPGFIANYSADFTFDETCVGTDPSFCGLRITLRYNPTAGTPSQGEVLTGLLFEPQGSADFRDGPPGNVPFGGTVGAEVLVGSGAAIAAGELGSVIINSVSYVDVSGHWGLNPAVAFDVESGFGSHYLASVGDLLTALNITTSTLGAIQLFPGTISSIEPSPPNGSSFGILDLNSIPNGGFPSGNIAFAQEEIVANLLYTGTLTSVNLVDGVFGTSGNPVPEPGTAALIGFGLLGLLGLGRKLKKTNR